MNFTGGNTLPNLGKRINWQLAVLAGGLALAISAGALAGAFERGSSPSTTAVTGPAPVPASIQPAIRSFERLPQVYIIVDSPARAAAIQSVISTEAAGMEGLQEDLSRTQVVTIETPEEQAQFDSAFAIASAELDAAGVGIRVVDLREAASPVANLSATDGTPNQAETIVYVVGSDAEKVALEQQFHESSVNQTDLTRRSVIVISEGQEHLYNTIAGEQFATGAFSLVDLR